MTLPALVLVHGGGHAANCWDLTADEIGRLAPELSVGAHLERPVSEYVRSNVFVTPGGIFSTRYLHWALEVLGAERIMLAVDYPFAPAAAGVARHFLDVLDDDDRAGIVSGNWDRMSAGIRR